MKSTRVCIEKVINTRGTWRPGGGEGPDEETEARGDEEVGGGGAAEGDLPLREDLRDRGGGVGGGPAARRGRGRRWV